MACLEALPVELLCEIFQYVHDSCESSNDLFSVSLPGRKYYPVARDVLYKAPRLLQPKPTDDAAWYYRRRHQLRSLLRTMISQPHLAKQICELEMTVALVSTSGWTPRTPDELCTIDVENEAVQSLMYASVHWTARIRSGEEAATCALILCLIPSLRRLYLNAVRIHADRPEIYSVGISLVPFKTSTIARFRGLLSLETDGGYSPRLLIIPILEALELRELYFNPRFLEKPTNVSSITLHAHLYSRMALEEWREWAEYATSNMSRSLQCLPSLKTLHLIVTGTVCNNFRNYLSDDYYYPLMAPTLHTFIYDSRVVFHHREVQTSRPSPIETFFVDILHGLAEANNSPHLERVEMWPGQYEGDTETAFALPEVLRPWSEQFTMYTGDEKSLTRVRKGKASSDAVWPYQIMYRRE